MQRVSERARLHQSRWRAEQDCRIPYMRTGHSRWACGPGATGRGVFARKQSWPANGGTPSRPRDVEFFSVGMVLDNISLPPYKINNIISFDIIKIK